MDKVYVTVNGFFDVDLMNRVLNVFSELGFNSTLVSLHSSNDTLKMEFNCSKDKFDFSPDFFYEIEENIGNKIKVTNAGNEYTINVYKE